MVASDVEPNGAIGDGVVYLAGNELEIPPNQGPLREVEKKPCIRNQPNLRINPKPATREKLQRPQRKVKARAGALRNPEIVRNAPGHCFPNKNG